MREPVQELREEIIAAVEVMDAAGLRVLLELIAQMEGDKDGEG